MLVLEQVSRLPENYHFQTPTKFNTESIDPIGLPPTIQRPVLHRLLPTAFHNYIYFNIVLLRVT